MEPPNWSIDDISMLLIEQEAISLPLKFSVRAAVPLAEPWVASPFVMRRVRGRAVHRMAVGAGGVVTESAAV